MSQETGVNKWSDPALLVKEASALLDVSGHAASVGRTAVEEAIHHAHELVSPDLYVIERLKKAGMDPDYVALFGPQIHEKLAALIFLTKYKLLDIEHSSLQSRDIDDARHDLSGYVEILFRVQAVDALGIFFDYAASQRDSHVAWLWHNVCSRCLYLMALLSECRGKVLAFLSDRPVARRMIEELILSTRPEVANALRALVEEYNRVQPTQPPQLMSEEPAPYVLLYRQFEKDMPMDEDAVGISSLLTAQDRIQQAANAGDLQTVLKWIVEGSPAASRSAFRYAMSLLPPDRYVSLLEMALKYEGMDPVRLVAAVLELGAANRTTQVQGGAPKMNRALKEVALSTNEEQVGVAMVAVHEMGTVQAVADLTEVMEKAPLLQPAQEAVHVLRDLRRLPNVTNIGNRRPELVPSLQAARQQLLELQSLMEAAVSCPSDELTMVYLERLKLLKAIPELQQLCLRDKRLGELAQQVLHELNGGTSAAQ